MQKQLVSVLIFIISIFFAGCSKQIIYETTILDQQAYQSKYKPLIGSRNNVSRTIIDFGVVATIWVAPYKDQYGVLVAGHDIHVWLERPDFIPGSSVPTVNGDSKGIPTQLGKMPFSLSPSEIDRSDLHNDENIREFVNESYKNTDESIMQRIHNNETDKKK